MKALFARLLLWYVGLPADQRVFVAALAAIGGIIVVSTVVSSLVGAVMYRAYDVQLWMVSHGQ